MNIVDYVIIGIIGISVLFGLYRGFIASVLNMGCGLMSFLASFWVSPKLAAAVQSNQSFLNMLLHYTDASSRIGDLEPPSRTSRRSPARASTAFWRR